MRWNCTEAPTVLARATPRGGSPLVCAAIGVAAIAANVAHAQPASLSLANRAYVRIPNSADFTMPQFTLAMWLKPTGPGEFGGGTLISKSGKPDTGNLLCSWWMGWSSASGKVLGMVVHQYGTSGKVVTSDAVVSLNEHAHAALTFNGITLRLYINGVLDQEAPFGFTGVYYSNEDVLIGGFNANSGYTFNRFDGTLDEVCVWSRALSASEVAALATCEPTISSNGLVAYLPFTDLSLADASGNGHSASALGIIGFGAQHASLCPSDFNCDGQVDDADFVAFVASYNELVIPPADPRCDLNGDGFVDDADFILFAVAYNTLVCL